MSAERNAHRRKIWQPTSTRPESRAHERRVPICVAEALEPRFQLAASVLTPALGATTLPAAVLGGAKTNATATVDLTNSSAGTVSGPAKVQLYFSTTPVFDANAVLITTFTKSGNLKAAGVEALKIKLKAIPDVPNGSYYLLVNVTDPGGNTATTSSTGTTTIAAPFIALSETFSRLTIPASVRAGAKISAVASLTVTNNGNVASTGNTAIALYASPTGTFSSGDTQLTSLNKPLVIKPGASKLVNLPLKTVPAALPDGIYHVLAQVTDSKGDVTTAASSTTFTAGAAPQTLTISGAVDGSGVMQVNPTSVSWTNTFGVTPTSMLVNGQSWNPSADPSASMTGHLVPNDLTNYQVHTQVVSGRDIANAQIVNNQLMVFFADTPNGQDNYQIQVSFTPKPQPIASAPATIHIVATIDGSDVLHITNTTAIWTHGSWGSPKNVSLNGIAWDTVTQPTLPNSGATTFLPAGVDLSTVQLTKNSGRDTATYQIFSNSLDVYFGDNQLGVSTYDVTLTFGPDQ